MWCRERWTSPGMTRVRSSRAYQPFPNQAPIGSRDGVASLRSVGS